MGLRGAGTCQAPSSFLPTPAAVSSRKLPLLWDQNECPLPGLVLRPQLRRSNQRGMRDRSSWHHKHPLRQISWRCDRSLFLPGPMGSLSHPTFHDAGLPLATRLPETRCRTESFARTVDGCASGSIVPELVCQVYAGLHPAPGFCRYRAAARREPAIPFLPDREITRAPIAN